MFDVVLPGSDSLAGLDDAALVTAIGDCAMVEAAAGARRLAVIAEFITRRMDSAEHGDWMVDDWDAAAVEVGAALNVSVGRAGGQMDLAMTLRTRLPRVAALLARGAISVRTAATIARRTDLIQDSDALAAVDDALAEHAVTYGPLSDRKLETAIDVWVTAVDPDAVRRTRSSARDRDVAIGDPDDHDGLTTVWARLLATDGKILGARLAAMAAAVCDNDPRTVAQRRADALGALGAGSTHLTCACGAPTCAAATPDGRATSVVIHVLADADTHDADPDPACHGQDPTKYPDRSAELRADRPTQPAPVSHPAADPATPAPPRRAAVIVGGPILPAPLLAELIHAGATIRYLSAPGTEPESRYRPSTALNAWIRMRDLTCRAPGCDKPAVAADIDHTMPWPAGPTHPSNTKIYCRLHHLIKTFWPGFTDRQHPDGTIAWTTPTGHTYTTHPLSRLLLPTWNTTTTALPKPTARPPTASPNRTQMMPKRKRTRTKERQYRINTERTLNQNENPPPPF